MEHIVSPLWRMIWPGPSQVGVEKDWRRDPLSHPDLRRMSARELADLPLVPECPQP